MPTKRFRLIDCKAYLNGVIRIVEYSSAAIIPPYAAISYVWKGIHQAKHAESFAVAGALDGDPISQEVLRITCITAIEQGVRYIWLDRLCILQTSDTDKDWQIQNMAGVYEKCHMSRATWRAWEGGQISREDSMAVPVVDAARSFTSEGRQIHTLLGAGEW